MVLQILPYALGAAASPVLLISAVILLSQPAKPIKQCLAYSFGALLAITIIGSALFFAVHFNSHTNNPSTTTDNIHIAIGILLLILAVRMFRKKADTNKTRKKNVTAHYWRDFALGISLMAVNFSTIILFVPAAVEMQNSSDFQRLVALAIMIMFAMIPVWLPLGIIVVMGKNGKSLLVYLSKFMNAHGHQIAASIVGLIGFYVLAKGITGH